MFARIVLFLLMGVGLAGFGVVAWINLHPAAPPPSTEAAAPNDNIPLLIAARPLRAGTLLMHAIAVLALRNGVRLSVVPTDDMLCFRSRLCENALDDMIP